MCTYIKIIVFQEEDSDFEFDGVRIKKTKSKKSIKTKAAKIVPPPTKIKDVRFIFCSRTSK